jgi:hypothetical protein
MKPSHSRRTNDTPSRHPDGVPLGALLRRVVVLLTARPASHRGIPSLPVPGRRRAPWATLIYLVFSIAVFAPTTPAAAAPEVRWIAYVRTQQEPVLELEGDLITVRSDGRGQRTLIEGGVVGGDLGPGGIVHVARQQEPIGNRPPSTSLVTARIDKPMEEVEEEADTYFYFVAASPDGDVAFAREVTDTQEVPPFLSGGVDDLRLTSVPVLVPPEEPSGTIGLVPTAERDSYQLLFTNDPRGELAHVEQINVLVSGTTETVEPVPDPQSQQVSIRGGDGQFFCGASTCFLTWQELGATYTVGEFGGIEEAVSFAESLVSIELLAGAGWQEGTGGRITTPELVVRDTSGKERILDSPRKACDCAFGPLDWNPGGDRLLVLAGAEGHISLREYRTNGSREAVTLFDGAVEIGGRDDVSDAAYGSDGVVALLANDGGRGLPGNLWELETDKILATDVRAFDVEGSTMAYVDSGGDIVVRDLPSGEERTIGAGAIDVSVSPDVIRGAPVEATPSDDRGLPILPVVVIAGAVLALFGGVALFSLARRRRP